jgi:hypothetical protein
MQIANRRAASRRPVVQIVAIIAAIAGLMLVWASLARAGTWALVSCAEPGGQPAPTAGWSAVPITGPGNYSGAYSTCAQQGGSLGAESSNAAPQPRGSGWMWEFDAPTGSTIAGGTVTLSVLAPQGQSYLATPNNTYDGADVVSNCQFNEPCGTNGTLTTTVPITHPGGTHLYAAAQCIGPGQPGAPGADCAQGDGASGVNAQIAIQAADIDLANNAVPTASGFTGSLLSLNAGGMQDLVFTASDPNGPGVQRVTATVDSKPVYDQTPDLNAGACQSIGNDAVGAPEYLSVQPCKSSETVQIPVNTTPFGGGLHHLVVTVTDAAGNSSPIFDGTIATAGPAAAGGPLGTAAGWNVSLRVSPRRVHRHTLIKLTGNVSTAPRPHAGKLIYLQARTLTRGWRGRRHHHHRAWLHGPWITFQALRAKPDGTFTATYRFHLGGRHRYQMRAVAPQEGGFQNPTGNSPTITLTET